MNVKRNEGKIHWSDDIVLDRFVYILAKATGGWVSRKKIQRPGCKLRDKIGWASRVTATCWIVARKVRRKCTRIWKWCNMRTFLSKEAFRVFQSWDCKHVNIRMRINTSSSLISNLWSCPFNPPPLRRSIMHRTLRSCLPYSHLLSMNLEAITWIRWPVTKSYEGFLSWSLFHLAYRKKNKKLTSH